MLPKVAKIALIVDLVGLHVLGVYMLLRPQVSRVVQTPVAQTGYVDQCGEACQDYINTKLSQVQAAQVDTKITPTAIPKVTPTPVVQTKTVVVTAPAAKKQKVRSTTYLTVPGSGSTGANEWVDVPGSDFYFDKSDYPGLIYVYFEATASLQNGNGMAYIRLVDVTHGIAVQGAEAQTNSQTPTVVSSGDANFWSGRNLIRVQVKSLTADTTIFAGGRLRLIVEN